MGICLIESVFNLQINLGTVNLLTISISIHEHGIFLYFLGVSNIFQQHFIAFYCSSIEHILFIFYSIVNVFKYFFNCLLLAYINITIFILIFYPATWLNPLITDVILWTLKDSFFAQTQRVSFFPGEVYYSPTGISGSLCTLLWFFSSSPVLSVSDSRHLIFFCSDYSLCN